MGGGGANAVKQVTLIGGAIRNYGYDASGNMTGDDNSASQFAAKYDHANLATKLQRGAVINYFTYGPNNAKARQTGSDGSKVYLGDYEDWITAGQTKVSLGNYAQLTNGTGGRVLHYFLTDRLGSVDAVTDGNGNLIETRGYDAFGAPRTGVWADASQIASTAITPKGFTSHEHLNSVKLIHMNGRMYDFQLGRFLGVDPFIQAPTNSQSLNPYSYIMNNPLSGTDPTGYTTECVDAACPEPAPPKIADETNSETRGRMACGGQCATSAKPDGNGVHVTAARAKQDNAAQGQSANAPQAKKENSNIETVNLVGSTGDGGEATVATYTNRTMLSEKGEDGLDFLAKTGKVLVELSEKTGFEYCHQVCYSPTKENAFMAKIITIRSHIYCGTNSGMCTKAGYQDSGFYNHSHGPGDFAVNEVDYEINLQQNGTYRLGQKISNPVRDEFSTADYANPGFLSYPGGIIFQDGRSKETQTIPQLRLLNKGIIYDNYLSPKKE